MSYRQSELIRITTEGTPVRTVAYIPSSHAVIGKNIQVRENDIWNDWKVERVSSEISDVIAQKIQKMWHGGWNNNI